MYFGQYWQKCFKHQFRKEIKIKKSQLPHYLNHLQALVTCSFFWECLDPLQFYKNNAHADGFEMVSVFLTNSLQDQLEWKKSTFTFFSRYFAIPQKCDKDLFCDGALLILMLLLSSWNVKEVSHRERFHDILSLLSFNP